MGRRGLVGEFFVLASLAGCLTLAATGVGFAEESSGAACATCHEDRVKAFAGTTHGNVAYRGEAGGCEACHGDASQHAQTGDATLVVNPAKVEPEKASETCLECHSRDKGRMFWQGSVHESQGNGCTSCHQVHPNRDKLLAKADEKEVCLSCHFDVRADLLKRSKHPLRDSSTPSMQGKMACSSCHNPHGGRSEALIDAKSINDKCYECHFEKKAPLLWEHTPVKEDCLICHKAHGSNNDKLLVTKVPRLCQECHIQGRHQSGTFATNSVFAFNRGCLNCHTQVHGSNSPSGAILQR